MEKQKTEIKQSEKEAKASVNTEVQTIDFSNIKSSIAPSETLDQGFKLLGELLMFLRKNRLMPMLMICRTIQKIEVNNGIAIISSEQDDVNQLISNENYKSEMDKFMKEHDLSFKIKEKEYKVKPVDILNELVGGKLVIK